MKKITLLIALVVCALNSLNAQDPVTYEQAFPNLSFEYPVEIQNAKDGSNRIFVVEQSGRIKVFQNTSSTTQQQVFLDLRSQISFSAGQEIGLLGLAFHPNYSSNGYFYVYHTRSSSISGINTEMVLARYQVSSNSNAANPSSRVEIFSFDKNQVHSNHNGGKIEFGPDGYLYVSIGDGGGGGDPQGNAQNLNSIFGSILRIDIDVDGNNPLENNPDAPNGRYEIPSDNPRVGQSGLDELYAWGIRNTWKFSFDNATNRLWGGDVGQGLEEEINIIQKGGNYGWRRYEGTRTYSSSSLVTSPDIKPVYRYTHSNGDLSITGGYVYRGSSTNTALQGKYVYGDFVSGRVWALDYNGSTASSSLLFRTSGLNVSSFGLDEAGELYFSSYGTSAKIYKIVGGNEPVGPTTVAVDGVGDWKELDNGTNGIVEAVVTKGDNIYVGGSFSSAGGTSASNIAWYNKNSGWRNLSSGANGTIYALAIASDGKLYVGGTFTSIGGVAARNVAVWNGSSWSALSSGTNGKVAKIGIDGNNNMYVGGAFSTAGGISVNNIARWSSGSWAALTDSGTSVSGTNNEIRAIAFDTNNTLYVGGNFDNAGGRTANRIATWNGSNWGTLGSGTSGFVQAIVVTSQSIYAGGNFTQAGGKTVNRIARWVRSSSTWNAMGNGVSGNVNALDFDGTYVYVGGNFETAANDASTNFIMKGMARWSAGQAWQALGPGKSVGTNNIVNDLDLSDTNERLYVGGNYGVAGNVSASNMGIWSSQGFDCSDEALTTEYRINGTWSSGEATITVDEGDTVVLSLLPNDLSFTVTSPSGNSVSGDYDLGTVTESEAGSYTFTTSGGCTTSLNLVVNNNNPCTEDSVRPEYRLNGGSWTAAGSKIIVDEGDIVVLGIKPDGTSFTITLPNGQSVNNDYSIDGITPAQEGIYAFTTTEGCTANLEIEVNEDTTVNCTASSVIPEYRIGSGSWISGDGQVSVDKGTSLSLGIKPDDTSFSILLPNGTTVNGDYTITDIQPSQAGNYVFTTDAGCSATFAISVIDDGVVCDAGSIITEYQINGIWQDGLSKIDVPVGTPVVLSMLPNNIGLVITRPDGTTVGDNYSLGNATTEQSGIYTLTSSEGCTTTLEVNVFDDSACAPGTVIPEYRLNGVWASGETSITVDEGTDVMLSILPNSIDVVITLPNGAKVGDDYSLGNITVANAGTYLFETPDGCTASLLLVVPDNENCPEGSIINEYRIDGTWASGNEILNVTEGTEVALSMLPNNVPVTITTPSGEEFGDNYDLGAVVMEQSGIYVLETRDGCVSTITLVVREDIDPCASSGIIPEYRIDGVWLDGDDQITVDEGTNVMLSMLPNYVDVTITTPNGAIVGDDYALGNVTPSQSGVYTLDTGDGCTQTITLNVRDLPNCDADSVVPEYRLNGVWQSGANYLNIKQGTEVVLSILNNDVGMTITLPDGRKFGNDYNLGNFTSAKNGIYVLTSSLGCKTTLELYATAEPGSRIIVPNSSSVDFLPSNDAGSAISAFPNPTTDLVTVGVRGLSNKGFTLIVSDMGQQQLMTEEYDANHADQIQVDLSNFSSGIYILNFKETDGRVRTQRVIKN
ncbi:T9SS type A sorting domain-containing protein [Aggregatimonas sangjinii]|uniref:T9SS type A sorting domain-containing protein n=1 Tax=Aggregatimonas sangjinii TaxID=2583587 RepID=A0A5B7SPR3_9FLAO|nr:PQQ-dependent sugar dehydrogenase [Aggregatimonas sangjinii]QCW99378.1 T9SS type A sorting domain-containing protein [Aggregatimonas sangjinii]